MKSMEVKNSSFVCKIAYSHKKHILMVMLKSGNIYQYENVPVGVAREFASAESKGQYYNENIKDSYESTKAS